MVQAQGLLQTSPVEKDPARSLVIARIRKCGCYSLHAFPNTQRMHYRPLVPNYP
jgi:hypothetical protein